MTSPYRESDGAARYLCTVCMHTASTTPGPCAACKVERPPLDNPEVVAELRKYAATKEQRRQARGWTLVIGVGTLIAVAIYLLLCSIGWINFRPHESAATMRYQLFSAWLIVIWLVVVVPMGLVYKRWRPERDDADTATVPQLLSLLGVVVEK